ncbi:MAG TPA: trimethylamine methyltransferase family protein [Anaerolineae bacterium]|nr:trimethylamine methyltransferase family protein [Anaerolineae bacterium]
MRPTLRLLDEAQHDQVLDEALRILAEVGVTVAGEGMRQRLLDAGFGAREEDGRVLFPPDKVRAAVASAPASFTIFDRAGDTYAEFGVGQTHFSPGSSGLSVLDHRSGRHRAATSADIIDYLKVGDQLRHIRLLATAFSSADIEPQVSDAWRLYLLLRHTAKACVTGAFSAHAAPRLVQLMQLYRRDAADLAARPMAICTVTAAGQFSYNEDSCQNLIDFVEAGIPVEIVPVTLMGLHAPVTLLGAAAFHTADVLAGVTMAQLVKPGAPTLFGGSAAAFHMQTTTAPMTAIEALRLTAACSLIGKHLGMPTQAYTAFSEARSLDAQAGSETAMGALLAVQTGMDSVSGAGMLDYLLTFSLPKLVVDDEIAAQALHFGSDVQVAGDIPTSLIIREMLEQGHLLASGHTMEHWPTALHLPGPAWDRDARAAWAAKGELDIVARAAAEVERLLATYEPPHTDAAVDREARAIIRSALSGDAELPA